MFYFKFSFLSLALDNINSDDVIIDIIILSAEQNSIISSSSHYKVREMIMLLKIMLIFLLYRMRRILKLLLQVMKVLIQNQFASENFQGRWWSLDNLEEGNSHLNQNNVTEGRQTYGQYK